MREDLKKLREDDLVVCNMCGSEEIEEPIFAKSNSCIIIDGEPYYKWANEVDDTQYWCDSCNDMARPVHISEWEEIKRENEDE